MVGQSVERLLLRAGKHQRRGEKGAGVQADGLTCHTSASSEWNLHTRPCLQLQNQAEEQSVLILMMSMYLDIDTSW